MLIVGIYKLKEKKNNILGKRLVLNGFNYFF